MGIRRTAVTVNRKLVALLCSAVNDRFKLPIEQTILMTKLMVKMDFFSTVASSCKAAQFRTDRKNGPTQKYKEHSPKPSVGDDYKSGSISDILK